MERKDITQLLDKVKAGTASPAEEAAVKRWLHELNTEGTSGLSDADLLQGRAAMWQAIRSARAPRVRRLWPRIVAAASVLLVLGAGTYFLSHRQYPVQQVAMIHDVLPGVKKAVLKLSSGRQISLTDAKTGQIAKEGNTNITKESNGQLAYNSNRQDEAIVYNTVTTARGNYYPLKLSDGTVAILDAGSSIKYPVAFNGKERLVEITGQVYFEVTHNEKQPFKVKVKGQTVEDLGTQFNINAYDDEPAIVTTLVQGSVKVNSALLKPGQEAVNRNQQIEVKTANIAQVIAWKDGNFNFDHTDFQSMMRQLSRWYDLQVIYEGKVADPHLFALISRNVTLANLLKAMTAEGIHYDIENNGKEKKLIIKP